MCGRYYVADDLADRLEAMKQAFGKSDLSALPGAMRAGDVRPSREAIVLASRNDVISAVPMRWGFTAFEGGKLLINARAETARQKKTFASSIERRRCAIPASRFYERNAAGEQVSFRRSDGQMLFLAGFYRPQHDGDRFIILTTAANESMLPLHDRMPLLLKAEDVRAWTDDNTRLDGFLRAEQPALTREQEYEQLTLDF
ncbi:MAG: SOS response-associated peptidase [Anaerovoracaceae bacterium]|jgi:putative SOS response-associated peptidase YedK